MVAFVVAVMVFNQLIAFFSIVQAWMTKSLIDKINDAHYKFLPEKFSKAAGLKSKLQENYSGNMNMSNVSQ